MIIFQGGASLRFRLSFREQTHGVGRGEVDAEASGSRAEQKDKDVRPAGRVGRWRECKKQLLLLFIAVH